MLLKNPFKEQGAGLSRANMVLADVWLLASAIVLIGFLTQPPLFRLHTNDAAMALIKEREGLRLKAYRDVAGHWSIGYGHTGGVTKGQKISRARAEAYFREDIREAEADIKRMLRVPVTQDEFSALVMLVYNIGPTAFARSTVLKELNRGNKDAAANAFLMWNMVRVDNHPVESAYLSKYRRIERDFFLGPQADKVPVFAVYPIPLPVSKPAPKVIKEELPVPAKATSPELAQDEKRKEASLL